MILPGAYSLVRLRHQDFLDEVAADRLAAQVRRPGPRLRKRVAAWLYWLAAQLSASVVDARAGSTLVRTMTRRNGVEYWRPLPRTRLARH